MEVWAVTLDATAVNDLNELYNRALSVLDYESSSQVQKYYHRIDSVRGLIGRLLPRLLLKGKGIPVMAMTFAKTQAGKPYITTPITPHIGYNITHDNGIVAMAFSIGSDLYSDPPAYRIGIDVMLLQLPKRDTFQGFVEIFNEQLTDLERNILIPLAPAPPLSQHEQLRRFYLIWTLKEAYTKALGLGMGFDFSRIEYDVPNDLVRVDGVEPRGWEFTRFALHNELKAGDVEDYVGVVARFVGDSAAECEKVRIAPSAPAWFKVYGAAQFLSKAIAELAP
ncbi:hypothetical protein L226DRAFT_613241 [Lentinus tigrinus ALCF2SS1-7]|uniref:holo-[acyl-carrier-protein] synthase n=1 Tax=Lentinus tigrinus ALCF2SS1-6 TaxID=1328759 RepID=A0A5C2SKA2_9APHY|nr:hypothetical protein L227DRAFT_652059 [Lentinus tigrinus ALCF2SS1-6]RPD74371.1 hypothetical protein L226DRAFT_613241 [Lentinus tigrinus ALCF2SS1-7]